METSPFEWTVELIERLLKVASHDRITCINLRRLGKRHSGTSYRHTAHAFSRRLTAPPSSFNFCFCLHAYYPGVLVALFAAFEGRVELPYP